MVGKFLISVSLSIGITANAFDITSFDNFSKGDTVLDERLLEFESDSGIDSTEFRFLEFNSNLSDCEKAEGSKVSYVRADVITHSEYSVFSGRVVRTVNLLHNGRLKIPLGPADQEMEVEIRVQSDPKWASSNDCAVSFSGFQLTRGDEQVDYFDMEIPSSKRQVDPNLYVELIEVNDQIHNPGSTPRERLDGLHRLSRLHEFFPKTVGAMIKRAHPRKIKGLRREQAADYRALYARSVQLID